MPAIKVGNAPCSWGTLEFDGAQAGRLDCDRMLDELVATGYTASDLGDWGFMPTDPAALAEKFNSRGLALTGAFVPVKLRDASAHGPGLEQSLRTARLLRGAADRIEAHFEPYLVLADDNGSDEVRTRCAGRIDASMGLSPEEWKTFAAGANHIAAQVRDQTGIRTVFHHHCAGFVETPREIDVLLDGTDPDVIGLVFDTGHYSYGAGGCEGVLDALERYASRIWYVHFKDMQPELAQRAREEEWDYFEALRHGIFCELGDGCVDFAAVRDWMQRNGYTGYVTVEQDVLPGMGSPKESADRDRAYLRTLGL